MVLTAEQTRLVVWASGVPIGGRSDGVPSARALLVAIACQAETSNAFGALAAHVSVGELIKVLDMPRTTMYRCLRKLKKQNLIFDGTPPNPGSRPRIKTFTFGYPDACMSDEYRPRTA